MLLSKSQRSKHSEMGCKPTVQIIRQSNGWQIRDHGFTEIGFGSISESHSSNADKSNST